MHLYIEESKCGFQQSSCVNNNRQTVCNPLCMFDSSLYQMVQYYDQQTKSHVDEFPVSSDICYLQDSEVCESVT